VEIKIGDITRIKNIPKRRIIKPDDDDEIIYRKDRRNRKNDRRKSVRDGVYVSFSFKNDRRKGGDRRKKSR